MHQDHFAEGRSAARLALDEDGRRHVHEGERHELREAPGLLLEIACAHEVPGDMHRPFHGAVHDRHIRFQAHLVRGPMGEQPFLGGDLVGADDRAHLVVEDLRRRSGKRGESGLLQSEQVFVQRHAEPAGALRHLEGREPVHVDRGRDFLDRAGDIDVVVAVEIGMDPALQADLGRAARDGFDHPPLHLLHLEEIRLPAEVERERSLRERAEFATVRAHVCVVDVAIAHEGDLVADDRAAQLIGDFGDPRDFGTARREQRHDLADADLFTREHPGEHLTDRS